MVSFTGILKYSIYLFILGWMFFLGIMVGRGNSPVTFDTQGFQERLQTIASEFGHENDGPKKIEIQYDILENSSGQAGSSVKHASEIMPGKDVDLPREKIQTKISLKKQTYNPDINIIKAKPAEPKKQVSKSKPVKAKSVKTVSATPKPETIKQSKSGQYTIQIAAYKDFKDAVTQMAILEKKGFSSYRIKVVRNGTTWYRVRVGSFNTYEDAKKFKVRLDKAKINSMIMKKEDNENIKG